MKLSKLISPCRHPLVALSTGIILGAIIIFGIRFVSYAPANIHYHANFEVYLNGERQAFKDPRYYQEVAICSTGQGITVPQARAHLHDADNSAIHIHDHAVTWGQFFNNLGWVIGPDFIETDNNTLYREDATSKLHIYINDQDYTGLTNLTNTIIKDKDRLLISYGNQDETMLLSEAKAVPSTASMYDTSHDPASCAGDEKVTLLDRFKHLF